MDQDYSIGFQPFLTVLVGSGVHVGCRDDEDHVVGCYAPPIGPGLLTRLFYLQFLLFQR